VRSQGPERDAAALFAEGASSYARGEFRAAALAFEEAYRRAPRGATKYDAAIAWEQAKALERAADDFEAALTDPTLDAKLAREAGRHLSTLAQRVGRVDIRAEPGVSISIAHVQRAHAPLRVNLTPGSHELRADYPSGESTTLTITVDAGATQSIEVPSAQLAPPSASASRSAPAIPIPAPENTASRPSAVPTTLGWSLVGTGVLAGGAASAFGVIALGARDDFFGSAFTDQNAHDRAATFRTACNVAWISAAVLGATGIVLLIVARTGAHHPSTAAP
jgi:hypothetical protein